MKYLFLLMLVTGCANTDTAPWCTTQAGSSIIGVPPDNTFPITSHKYGNMDWSCESLQKSEDLFLEAVDQNTPQFSPYARYHLKYVNIYFHDGDSWLNRDGIDIAGQAMCEYNSIQLSSSTPTYSAYAHEMFHIFQYCSAPAPIDEGRDGDHADWNRSGIQKALDYWLQSWNL